MPPRKHFIEVGVVEPLKRGHGNTSRMIKDMDRAIQSKPVLRNALPRLVKVRKK